ncbi:XRE family transcriptional regulator [bacterium]|nr:MAG: XRE family transcriptional regulator [bacterium]
MAQKRRPAAEQLREFRTSRGHTLLELGNLVGCSEAWVWQLENTTRPPGLRLALALERVAGIAPESWPQPERKARRKRAA